MLTALTLRSPHGHGFVELDDQVLCADVDDLGVHGVTHLRVSWIERLRRFGSGDRLLNDRLSLV